MRQLKYFTHVLANGVYKRKVEGEIKEEVKAKVTEKVRQLEFLESMIYELEEELKIEQRKKAILKN
jgi:hypothetical protein